VPLLLIPPLQFSSALFHPLLRVLHLPLQLLQREPLPLAPREYLLPPKQLPPT
jgi:hypothetical protein